MEQDCSIDNDFRNCVEDILQNFLKDQNSTEFGFSSELNGIQRKYIHQKCRFLGINSKSQGREPNRRLFIIKVDKGNTSIFNLVQNEDVIKEINSSVQLYRTSFNYSSNKRFTSNIVLNDHQTFNRLNLGRPVYIKQCVNIKSAEIRQQLPIFSKRNKILQLFSDNQVIILTSETGSGKTTQIPQFILEDSGVRNVPCKILCAQPRRLSTIAAAERVAWERAEKTGSTVGYQVKLKYLCSPNTALIYCTNGILLRTVMHEKDNYLTNVTHVIIDEIHERDKNADFLLIYLKRCLKHNRSLRIILMSATVDVNLFANYFPNSAILHIPGRLYTVKQYFLEEILVNLHKANGGKRGCLNSNGSIKNTPEYTEDTFEIMSTTIEECIECGKENSFVQLMHLILSENTNINFQTHRGFTPLMAAAMHGKVDVLEQLLNLGANIDLVSYKESMNAYDWAKFYKKAEVCQLLEMYIKMDEALRNDCPDVGDINAKESIDMNLIVKIIHNIHQHDKQGAILIFLPGYEDIMNCFDNIIKSELFKSEEIKVFMLHGSMNIDIQHKVFNTCYPKQKIVLSTNIAETSITIPDVVYVIDSGKAKEKTYDAINASCTLQKIWISKASALQRAGRAGRTQNGVCFHIFSKKRYESMLNNSIPEILRVPLHELCLQAKLLTQSDIIGYLQDAMEPPSPISIRQSIQALITLEALDEQENLTVLGRHLVSLSVEPRLGKMLIYATIFKCLDPILTIVACLAYKEPFVLPPNISQKCKAVQKHRDLATESLSSHLSLLRAFQIWQEAKFDRSKRHLLEEYFIDSAAMEVIYGIRCQLLSQLRGAGFVSNIHELNINSNDWSIVKAALAVGCYPNIALKRIRNFITRTDERLVFNKHSALHNLSDNKDFSDKDCCVVYEEVSKINKLNIIKYATVVTALTVALVCGNEKNVVDKNLVIDNWLTFFCGDSKILEFSEIIKSIINHKVVYPQYKLNKGERHIFSVMFKLIHAEDIRCRLQEPKNIGLAPKVFSNAHCVIQEISLHLNGQSHRQGRVNQSYNNLSNMMSRNLCVADRIHGFSNNTIHNQYFRNNLTNINQEKNLYNFNILPMDNFELPERSKSFIIKPPDISTFKISITNCTWRFSPQTERKILQYFNNGYFIALFFNISKTQQFQGIAKLTGTNGGDITVACPIQWISTGVIDFPKILEMNINSSVSNYLSILYGKDGQELDYIAAKQLCKLFLTTNRIQSSVNLRPILGCNQ